MSDLYNLGFGKTENELYLQDIAVEGKIPDWLTGSFIRNGPGTFFIGQQQYRHWFDGLAMLHKFAFSEGSVSYANKFLRTKAYNEAMDTGKISYSEFATDPCRSMFGKVTAAFNQKITDSAKVNVGQFAQKYLALGETAMQVEFDPHTLDTLGYYQYETKYKQHVTTVHPILDSRHDEVYQHVIRFGRISHYCLKRIKSNGKSEVVGEIPVTYPAYLHSFGMTPRYLIIAEFPFKVYPLKLLFQVKPFIENYKWKPKDGTRFYVMDRQTGNVVGRLETDPFFAFHHINAFEKNNEIIMDIDAYDNADIISSFYLNRLKDSDLELPFGTLRRYRLNLRNQSVKWEQLSDECLEMPRYDNRHYHMDSSYNFVYGLSVNKSHIRGFYNQLVKIDITRQHTKTWYTANHYPSEPVFVPAPDAKSEDDGVVLTIVLDTENESSYLLVLDGQTFTEMGRAVVKQPILIGYHGQYFPEL
ncbi:MAG: beta-carotene 15,15'-monooxygenase [Caldithrix sp.]|nr:beta-carotene 15,15'-monooxygenase [Caldithrix sp.]